MILFKREHIAMILSGRKTQTRRIGKCRWKPGAIHQARTSLFAEPFAHLKIRKVYPEPLGAISDRDARAEGYPNQASYLETFHEINGETPLSTMVWVVRFERVVPV